MEESTNKSARRNWTKEETDAFLEAYGRRQAEFQHTRKKKYAMQNVLEDLLSQGVLTQYTTRLMLEVKLKNLLRAFKATRDNNKRTGEVASTAPHEQKMEELFGNRPEIKNMHSINLSGKPIIALATNEKKGARLDLAMSTSSSSESDREIEDTPSTSASAQIKRARELLVECRAIKRKVAEIQSPPKAVSHQHIQPSPLSTSTPKRNTMANRAKLQLLKQKNTILAEYASKRNALLEAAEKAKEDRYKRKEKLFRELFQNQK